MVVCTYNRRQSVERTLLALREQTYRPYEVIVVNGPSTDGTGEALKRYEESARIFDCPVAASGQARNVGVSHAASEIIAFVDDDAIPRPDWLANMVRPFRDKRVSSVGGPTFDVPLNCFDWKICTSTRLGVVDVDSPGPIGRYQGIGVDRFPYLAGCNVAHRRSALQEVGGFNTSLPYVYDDVDVSCHLNDAGFRFEYIERLQVSHYRESNATRDGAQVVVDPYALALGRIVFAAHCQLTSEGVEQVMQLALHWEAEWLDRAATHLDSGDLSPDQYERFVARVKAGTKEGMARGSQPRPFATLGPPPTDDFRQYY